MENNEKKEPFSETIKKKSRDIYHIFSDNERGDTVINKVVDTAKALLTKLEANEYEKICIPCCGASHCIAWMKETVTHYPLQAEYMFIYIQKNDKPQNDYDNYLVILTLLDAHKKIITESEDTDTKQPQRQKEVAECIPCGSIDVALQKQLDSNGTVLIKIHK